MRSVNPAIRRRVFKAVVWLFPALLLVLLVARLGARATEPGTSAPAPASAASLAGEPHLGTVREPLAALDGQLPAPPCWSCRDLETQPLRFSFDLDLLAPLGDGGDNLAVWLADFAPEAPRNGELEERAVDWNFDGQIAKILRADDPLLLEAEPWIDQAECSFYPEVWSFEGAQTRIPDMLMTLTLARSWIARGRSLEDGSEDFRRVVRLGRLLLQDDVTLIQDLVAVVNIRLGARELYELARRRGDVKTMLVASRAIGDADAIRMLYSRRMTVINDAYRGLHDVLGGLAGKRLAITDEKLQQIVTMAQNDPQRPLRWEAMYLLRVAGQMASRGQREEASQVLSELTKDSDVWVARMARVVVDEPLEPEMLEQLMVH